MKCSVQFTDDEKLQEHYMICTTSSSNNKKQRSSLSCYECDAVFISSKLLAKHRETAHKIEPRNLFEILQKPLKDSQKFKEEEDTRSFLDITFKCSYCGRQFSDKREFCNHLKKHHNVCSECDVQFEDKFFLMRHAKVCTAKVTKEEKDKTKRPRRKSSPVKSLKGGEGPRGRLRRRSNPGKETNYEEESGEDIETKIVQRRPAPGVEKVYKDDSDELQAESKPVKRGRGRPKGTKGKQHKVESEIEEDIPEQIPQKKRSKRVSRRHTKPLSESESDDLEMSETLKRQTRRVIRITNKEAEDKDSESDDYQIQIGKKSKVFLEDNDSSFEDQVHAKVKKTRQKKLSERSDSEAPLLEQFLCPICSDCFPSLSVVRRHSRSCGV